jgi:alanyl-tRNA synthetase
MHAALRKVLGKHVEQKGSLVDAKHLRFDFSHFAKMTDDEIRKVEDIVNDKVRQNIPRDTKWNVDIEEALEMGAMALFGEKYGEKVRVITFDPDYSIELCGGTHVEATGQIGLFKIISESAIAAGVRRIEATTGKNAEAFVNDQIETLKAINAEFKTQQNTLLAVRQTIEQNKKLNKELEKLLKEKALQVSDDLFNKADVIQGVKFIAAKVDMDVNQAKDLAHKLRNMSDNVFIVLALTIANKVNLVVSLSDNLVDKGMHAGEIIRQIAQSIKGGGGGQPHLATAGGRDASGIDAAFDQARNQIK